MIADHSNAIRILTDSLHDSVKRCEARRGMGVDRYDTKEAIKRKITLIRAELMRLYREVEKI